MPGAFPPGDLRVSDADRDRALSGLSEAFQAGRITADEFDERSGQALGARTGKALTALLADLPVDRGPADTARPRADRILIAIGASRIVIGASVAAACFAAVAIANGLSHGSSLQQRELAREIFARHGLSLPLPPSPGFDWAGTITPAAIAVLLEVLVVFSRATRGNRAQRPRRLGVRPWRSRSPMSTAEPASSQADGA